MPAYTKLYDARQSIPLPEEIASKTMMQMHQSRTDSRLMKTRLCLRLSFVQGRKVFFSFQKVVVRPRRFELLTYSFGGCRSIQLSYGRAPLA